MDKVTLPIRITSSSRHSFLDCPRKYFYEYIMRLTPAKKIHYFEWGKLIHDASEKISQGMTELEAIEALGDEYEKKAIKDGWGASEIEMYDSFLQMLPNALYGHLLRWPNDVKDFEVILCESKFALELPNGVIFEGKLDKIVRHTHTGRLYLWETKTPGRTGDSYYEGAELDSQLKGYLLAARDAFGLHVLNVVYDCWKKPQKQKAESWPAYANRVQDFYLRDFRTLYERTYPPFGEEAIEEYKFDLMHVSEMIEWCMLEGKWPMHHPKNRIGGCPFARVCLSGSQEIPPGFNTRSEEELFKELHADGSSSSS